MGGFLPLQPNRLSYPSEFGCRPSVRLRGKDCDPELGLLRLGKNDSRFPPRQKGLRYGSALQAYVSVDVDG